MAKINENHLKLDKIKGISMQRKLVLYWFTMAFAISAALVIILTFTGMFSIQNRQLGQAMAVQLENTTATIGKRMNEIKSDGVNLSEKLSRELNNFLASRGKEFDDLNDNPSLIARAEETLYPHINSALSSSVCSGAFFCLDATANTSLENSDKSRTGVYIRYSALNTPATETEHIVCFRGMAEVARREQVQMHNRWNPELDVSRIPFYNEMMEPSNERLGARCRWTGRIPLLNTWENVMLMCVPIQDGEGTVRGICGLEISDLRFSISCPAVSSPFGNMITVIAPIENDGLIMDNALVGNPEGTHISASGVFKIREGKYFNTYTDGNETYLGVHKLISGKNDPNMAVVILITKTGFDSYVSGNRMVWITVLLVFLLVMLILSVILSYKFVKPITSSLKAIREEKNLENRYSGISEVDELLAFLKEKGADNIMPDNIPPAIGELLEEFKGRVATLTQMERTVLQYYIEGCSMDDIAEKSFISISTVKKHNTNINRKLSVTSRDELMLYIELFRRCGRLEEISYYGK